MITYAYIEITTVKQCPTLNDLNNGRYFPLSCGQEDQDYKSWCNITCNEGFENENVISDRECLSDEAWSYDGENLNCTSSFIVKLKLVITH